MNPQLRHPRAPETARAIRAALERRATALAESHRLDPARVLEVLERTVRWQAGRLSPDAAVAADDEGPKLDFVPSFEEALEFLAPASALALFESADMDRLAEREAACLYLTRDAAPLYTTDELADLLAAFLEHLERNRDPLLRTGHPRTDFSRSWWLNWHLTKLYYTKLPTTIRMVRSRQTGDFERSYVWGEALEVDECLPESEGRAYEDAPIFENLDPADANRLEASRGKVFGAKVAILERLTTALRRRDAMDLWPRCLEVLTEMFLGAEVEFFLRIDRSYTGFDVLRGAVIDEEDDLIAGGLSDLLEVIGHCEKELVIGTMDRTKHRLLAISGALSVRSYYEAVGQPWRQELDAAIDEFVRLDAQEPPFWDGYRGRVNKALQHDFYDEVVIRTRVRRKVRAHFEPTVRTFADWQKAQLETVGTLTLLQLSQLTPQSPRTNTFRKDGDYWTLVYGQQEIRLRDRRGLAYIAQLLSQPERDVAAFDLQAAAGGRRVAAPRADSQWGRGQESLCVDGFGDAGEVLDAHAIAEFRRRMEELCEDLHEAEENFDSERAAAVRVQKNWIAEQLRSALGLGGRRRKSGDTAERIRKAVSKAIREAIAAIEREHPALGRHLNVSIRTGHLCCYEPAEPVTWET